MSQASHNTQPELLRLSEVLSDIGVDERTVMKRRRTYMLIESMVTSSYLLQDLNSSKFILGSQIEGTTTVGLKSDIDNLVSIGDFHVIQDLSECKPQVTNYLMIQDDTVAPGYCLLQRLSENGLRPNTHVSDEHHFRGRSGRVLLRNTIVAAMTKVSLDARGPAKAVRHGPAHALTIQGISTDFVAAFSCKSWPLKARQWLDQQGVGKWPSDDIRRCCSNTGCFVVGVGCKGSKYEEFEWRISTSLAERRLMFSLNITQIRCYVLMKMLLKTYIKPYYEEAISSFMCKTVLFQSIVNTHCNFWRESNLISCLTMCLLVLYNYVLNESCPHFIIPVNNLMAGHITHESKPHILEILQNITKSEGLALLEVKCDDLGARLLGKFTYLGQLSQRYIISGALSCDTSYYLVIYVHECLISISNCSFKLAMQTLLKYIFKLNSFSNQGGALDKKACTLLTPLFYTTLGSVLASRSIQQYNRISADALGWISMGLNTDVSSGKLKQASMFYSIGDSHGTEIVLRDIEGNYDLNIVEPICKCHEFNKRSLRKGFNAESDNHNEEAIQHIAAFCVRFLPCESNCVPHELRYEMFRSTKDDLAFRSKYDKWMDWAVADSLPYLYFLQYKIYSYLGRQDEKQRALSNLIKTIKQEPNLGHRETAFNLLGQCMEGEDRPNDALNYYLLSLSQRGRNNAAKIHICRLISKLVNDSARNQSFQ